MNRLSLSVALITGLLIGWLAAGWWPDSERAPAPDDWIARVGEQYVTQAEFEDEMRRRGGSRPGQFFSLEQRQALLDELLYRRALVAAAHRDGLSDQPVVRRSLDQILINRVLQKELRPRQEQSDIDPAEIEAFFNEHADEYAIPARRRVAMVFFELGPNASEETRAEVLERAAMVRESTLELEPDTRDFGVLARENSDHQASRYRGGVLGWVGEGDPSRYSYPEIVIETANAMNEAGAVSEILQDDQGLYLVRLVDFEAERTRTLNELADGIRQRLLRERFVEVEQAFRDQTLADADIEVRDGRLAALQPAGPAPQPESREQPPSLPASATQGN